MYPLNETPSVAVLIGLGLIIPLVVQWRLRLRSLVTLSIGSAGLAALAHSAFEAVVWGAGPHFLIGLGFTFVFYLPICLACGWLAHRIWPV